MNSKQIELSIENALKERQDLSPEFVNQLEDKLKQLKGKGFQERMETIKK